MKLRGVRTFPTTSVGRLFDTAAALTGFTRGITFEGQAAMWLEHLAGRCTETVEGYPFPIAGEEIDYRPLLRAVIDDRLRGRDPAVIARRFHLGIAQGVCGAVLQIAGMQRAGTVVLSGGVFQNRMLLSDLKGLLDIFGLRVWTNTSVPPNDGGVSLGQAALAAFGQFNEAYA
jgi:hydrogenase maturation protein HypF